MRLWNKNSYEGACRAWVCFPIIFTLYFKSLYLDVKQKSLRRQFLAVILGVCIGPPTPPAKHSMDSIPYVCKRWRHIYFIFRSVIHNLSVNSYDSIRDRICLFRFITRLRDSVWVNQISWFGYVIRIRPRRIYYYDMWFGVSYVDFMIRIVDIDSVIQNVRLWFVIRRIITNHESYVSWSTWFVDHWL